MHAEDRPAEESTKPGQLESDGVQSDLENFDPKDSNVGVQLDLHDSHRKRCSVKSRKKLHQRVNEIQKITDPVEQTIIQNVYLLEKFMFFSSGRIQPTKLKNELCISKKNAKKQAIDIYVIKMMKFFQHSLRSATFFDFYSEVSNKKLIDFSELAEYVGYLEKILHETPAVCAD